MVEFNRAIFFENENETIEKIDINVKNWVVIDKKLIRVINVIDKLKRYILTLYKILKQILF